VDGVPDPPIPTWDHMRGLLTVVGSPMIDSRSAAAGVVTVGTNQPLRPL
jgi:hypothetical protein